MSTYVGLTKTAAVGAKEGGEATAGVAIVRAGGAVGGSVKATRRLPWMSQHHATPPCEVVGVDGRSGGWVDG